MNTLIGLSRENVNDLRPKRSTKANSSQTNFFGWPTRYINGQNLKWIRFTGQYQDLQQQIEEEVELSDSETEIVSHYNKTCRKRNVKKKYNYRTLHSKGFVEYVQKDQKKTNNTDINVQPDYALANGLEQNSLKRRSSRLNPHSVVANVCNKILSQSRKRRKMNSTQTNITEFANFHGFDVESICLQQTRFALLKDMVQQLEKSGGKEEKLEINVNIKKLSLVDKQLESGGNGKALGLSVKTPNIGLLNGLFPAGGVNILNEDGLSESNENVAKDSIVDEELVTNVGYDQIVVKEELTSKEDEPLFNGQVGDFISKEKSVQVELTINKRKCLVGEETNVDQKEVDNNVADVQIVDKEEELTCKEDEPIHNEEDESIKLNDLIADQVDHEPIVGQVGDFISREKSVGEETMQDQEEMDDSMSKEEGQTNGPSNALEGQVEDGPFKLTVGLSREQDEETSSKQIISLKLSQTMLKKTINRLELTINKTKGQVGEETNVDQEEVVNNVADVQIVDKGEELTCKEDEPIHNEEDESIKLNDSIADQVDHEPIVDQVGDFISREKSVAEETMHDQEEMALKLPSVGQVEDAPCKLRVGLSREQDEKTSSKQITSLKLSQTMLKKTINLFNEEKPIKFTVGQVGDFISKEKSVQVELTINKRKCQVGEETNVDQEEVEDPVVDEESVNNVADQIVDTDEELTCKEDEPVHNEEEESIKLNDSIADQVDHEPIVGQVGAFISREKSVGEETMHDQEEMEDSMSKEEGQTNGPRNALKLPTLDVSVEDVYVNSHPRLHKCMECKNLYPTIDALNEHIVRCYGSKLRMQRKPDNRKAPRNKIKPQKKHRSSVSTSSETSSVSTGETIEQLHSSVALPVASAGVDQMFGSTMDCGENEINAPQNILNNLDQFSDQRQTFSDDVDETFQVFTKVLLEGIPPSYKEPPTSGMKDTFSAGSSTGKALIIQKTPSDHFVGISTQSSDMSEFPSISSQSCEMDDISRSVTPQSFSGSRSCTPLSFSESRSATPLPSSGLRSATPQLSSGISSMLPRTFSLNNPLYLQRLSVTSLPISSNASLSASISQILSYTGVSKASKPFICDPNKSKVQIYEPSPIWKETNSQMFGLAVTEWRLGTICCFHTQYATVAKHIVSHKHEATSFKCKDCEEIFTKLQLFLEHFKNVHELRRNEESHFKCLFHRCRQVFPTKFSLRIHEEYHIDKSSICMPCDKEVTHIGEHALKKHHQLMI